MTAPRDMSDIESAPRRERRVVGWPIGVVPAIFGLFIAWLVLSVMHVLGFYPSDTTRNVGVAQIVSCERVPLHLWLIQECAADVRWQEETADDGREETSKVVRVRVTIVILRAKYT